MNFKDLTGNRFGKLVVINYIGNSKWECQCDCGNKTIVRSDYLKYGHTKSCGCIHKKYGGDVRTDRLYRLYRGIIQRTTTLRNDKHNHTYIEKNITMCDEWRNDFNKFKEWAINNGYDYSKSSKEQTIDRIDNNKGYLPDNCRFVSLVEQNSNRFIKKGITCLAMEQQKKIVCGHQKGLSTRKLGEMFNVSKTTISNVLKSLTKEDIKK